MSRLYRIVRAAFSKKHLMEIEKQTGKIEYKARLKQALTSLKHFLFYEPYDALVSLYERTSNVISWLPILWKDRDWDYAFITKIFIFKLERTAKFMENSELKCCKKHSRQIRYAIHLIKEIEEFTPERFKIAAKVLHLKYGYLDFRDNKLAYTKAGDEKGDAKARKKDFRLLYEQIDAYKVTCRKRLYLHLSKYYRTWWE